MRKLTALLLAILMIFSLAACGETKVDPTPDEQETSQPQSTTAPGREYDESDPAAVLGEITNDFSDVTTNPTQKLEETFTQSENTGDATDGIRPEFKEAMDSYEAFYTEYCEFMKEYNENPTDLTLLAKYADMLVKAEEMNEAFEAWNEDELSNEELKYYLDVNNRVMKMLVDVAG